MRYLKGEFMAVVNVYTPLGLAAFDFLFRLRISEKPCNSIKHVVVRSACGCRWLQLLVNFPIVVLLFMYLYLLRMVYGLLSIFYLST